MWIVRIMHITRPIVPPIPYVILTHGNIRHLYIATRKGVVCNARLPVTLASESKIIHTNSRHEGIVHAWSMVSEPGHVAAYSVFYDAIIRTCN